MPKVTLNPGALADVRALLGDQDGRVLVCLIDCYLGDAPDILRAMRAAVAAADKRALHWQAHRLKGSSASLGAEILTDMCDEIRGYEPARDMAEAGRWLEALEAEYHRVAAALLEERRRLMRFDNEQEPQANKCGLL